MDHQILRTNIKEMYGNELGEFIFQARYWKVSFAAVICVVTQRFSPQKKRCVTVTTQ